MNGEMGAACFKVLDGLKKATELISEDKRPTSRDSNLEHPEYEAVIPAAQLRRLIKGILFFF